MAFLNASPVKAYKALAEPSLKAFRIRFTTESILFVICADTKSVKKQ